MGYTGGGFGKNGQGIVALVIPEMKSPRRCIGYDVVVSSFPTPSLAATREVFFIVGGFQNDFTTGHSTVELVDEMVVPDIPDSKNIVVDEIATNIPVCSTLESTLKHEHIYLYQPT